MLVLATLAGSLLLASSCGDTMRMGWPGVLSPPPDVTVDIQPNAAGTTAFGTATLQVELGTHVIWVNHDAIAHTVTSTQNAFDSGEIPPGKSYSHTFDATGTYPYFCKIHPSETNSVTVVEGTTSVPIPGASPTPTANPLPLPSPSATNGPAGTAFPSSGGTTTPAPAASPPPGY